MTALHLRPTVRLAILARVLLTALALLAAASASAQTSFRYGDPLWSETREALFDALKAAPDEATARALTDRIWRFWFIAPDEETAALMDKAMERRGVYDFAGAIEVLDQIVAHAPDYAEGWNQRATVLFLQEKYDRSLEDVERVLALEPNHFGALAGKGVILLRQGRARLAHQAIREALEINPYLPERQLLPPAPARPDTQDL